MHNVRGKNMNNSIFKTRTTTSLAIIFAAVLALLGCSLFSSTEAYALDENPPVKYVDTLGFEQECTDYRKISEVNDNEDAPEISGWWVVDQNATFPNHGLVLDGEVDLILCDGTTLDTLAILVEEGDTLTIWAQEGGSGKLNARGWYNAAGIGSGINDDCGTIIINGGNIESHGGTYGAGIGGGIRSNGGLVIINGGVVKAWGGDGGTITISGGHVAAVSTGAGAGIGGGSTGDSGDITITGGMVSGIADWIHFDAMDYMDESYLRDGGLVPGACGEVAVV